MKRALGALAVIAVVISGCGGGGQSDKQKIESTVHDYFAAFSDGDYAKACDALAERTREDLTKAARVKDCATALGRGAAKADVKQFAQQLKNVQVESVDVHQSTATAKVKALGSTTSVPLTKEGSDWKVQGPAGEEGD
jgi:ketosteroid isomerase-like protein